MTAPTIPERAAQVLRLLAAGQTVQHVADATGWPRRPIHILINRTPGWLHDPDRDTVYDPRRAGYRACLPDGVDPAPDAAAEAVTAHLPGTGSKHADENEHPLIALLERARDLDNELVGRALTNFNRAASKLRERVEIAETYRNNPGLSRGAAAAGYKPKAVRTWAADNGVACPDRGPVPFNVLVAYYYAHQSEDRA